MVTLSEREYILSSGSLGGGVLDFSLFLLSAESCKSDLRKQTPSPALLYRTSPVSESAFFHRNAPYSTDHSPHLVNQVGSFSFFVCLFV